MAVTTGDPEHRPMLAIDLPRAVVGFVGVHLGLRAEAAHVERRRDAGDLDGASRRAELLATVLHHHHRAEDTVLFPALVARQPGVVVTTEAMEAEHRELDIALATLPGDLDSAGDVRRLVERHLGHEEQLVLPVWMASFTTAEHERFAGALRRATPLRDAGLMIAWLLDTAPDDAFDVAWEQVPASLRLVHRVWWRRRYERVFGSCAASATPTMPLALAAA
jgi:hypothetical protein